MGQREILSLKASMKNKAVSVCRLDADSVLKKEVEPGQKDALSSAGYGLGRGVKRKLSNGEESALEIPYPQQRQLVMDLCVNKLQSCQRGAEPSLHRSVLLANTLRQIQQEMRLEGEDAWLLTSPAPFPPPTPRHVPELLPVPMSTSSSSSLGEDVKDCVESRPPSPEETVTKTPDSLFGTFEITNSTSYLTDLHSDDIFEDIDTSMYDSSEISVLTFSAPREDGLKNLSNLQLCLADLSDLDHIMDILLWLSNILLFFLLAVMRQNPDPTPVYIIVPNSTCML